MTAKLAIEYPITEYADLVVKVKLGCPNKLPDFSREAEYSRDVGKFRAKVGFHLRFVKLAK